MDGKPFIYYLPELSKTHTVIGLNGAVLDDNIRDYLDIIITIDYYTWDYLSWYPWLQHKMYVDKTVKKYFDKKNIMQEVTNIFAVDQEIHRENNGKLYLNRIAPTVLHCALNLCLIKAIEDDCLDTTNVRLWGIELSEDWLHYNNGHINDTIDVKKDSKTILGMRESTYRFKEFYNLTTLNKQTTLSIDYENLVKF